MANSESFVFYRSFRVAIDEMEDAEKLETLLGIIDYALDDCEPSLRSAFSRAVFAVAKPSIDSNKAKRLNGAKGGRPRKGIGGFETENRRFSKTESTETVTGTDTDTGTEANSADKPQRTPPFIPPTVEEVAEYCLSCGNRVDAQRFVDHYTSNGWVVGKTKMRDWQAAVRTWERNEPRGESSVQIKRTDADYDVSALVGKEP